MCPILLLAAGGSSRMATAKQSLPFGDTTLLGHAVETALTTGCGPVYVVLGAESERVMKESAIDHLAGRPERLVRIVLNRDWARGMGTSLRIGLDMICSDGSPRAVLVMLCDQPAVTSAHLAALLARFGEDMTIVASGYDDIAGVPAVIGARWFDELRRLDDAAGARQLFKRHPQAVHVLPFAEAATDVDTPSDYEALRESFRN